MTERALTPDWNAAALLGEYGIPPHLHGGLERYLKDRIPPGDFLLSILRNDLAGAMTRAADLGAVVACHAIVRFLQAEAPATAWGDRNAVNVWITSRPAGRPAAERLEP